MINKKTGSPVDLQRDRSEAKKISIFSLKIKVLENI